MIISRRRFFGFLAAPAIVQVANLMPIRGEILRVVDRRFGGASGEFNLTGDWTIDFWARRLTDGSLLIDEWRARSLEMESPEYGIDLAKFANQAPADDGWHHITISK